MSIETSKNTININDLPTVDDIVYGVLVDDTKRHQELLVRHHEHTVATGEIPFSQIVSSKLQGIAIFERAKDINSPKYNPVEEGRARLEFIELVSTFQDKINELPAHLKYSLDAKAKELGFKKGLVPEEQGNKHSSKYDQSTFPSIQRIDHKKEDRARNPMVIPVNES